jgi:GH15 family glucan-1,4-alpha-glucosidase/trehalose-6-phosphatase
LVASDYDGVIAPIVAVPSEALPKPESVNALRSLAGLHETTAAVISGRALRDLATLSRLPVEVHLVGSHGSEFDVGFVHAISAPQRDLLEKIHAELKSMVRDKQGVQLELKPASIAVPATWPGVHVTKGKSVLELAVIETNKGNALDILRQDAAATAALFIGDDVTDEKAFARLSGPDLGIKVGTGETLAEFQVDDTEAASVVLALLLEERRNWLYGGSAPGIERLTMLSNERSLALLSPDARVNWFCYPYTDSPAIFAELLGGPESGHFSIRPAREGLPLAQRYYPDTMITETRWSQLLVTDYLAHYTESHRTDLVRTISGSTPAIIEFLPRPEFGSVAVRLEKTSYGLQVHGTSEAIVLHSPGVDWHIHRGDMHDSARATVSPLPGQDITLELRCGTTDCSYNPIPEGKRREQTIAYDKNWVQSLTLPEREKQLVARAALTLRGLANLDTGGILAAATTSLPEQIGGVRNWDYRYCWLRDASLTAKALVSLGSNTEAENFLDWLHGVLATVVGPEWLHPLYTVHGTALGAEAVIDTLPGYAGSRPVRVGNLANQQVQLDVFGPVVELVEELAKARGWLSNDDWHLVQAMATAVSKRWTETDAGIWEERARPRHNVYSKVMGWVTIDRAIRIASEHGRPADPDWPSLAEQIKQDVLKNGWHPEAAGGIGAFTTAYDGLDLDAAALHIGLSGLIDPFDARFQATVTAIESELRVGSTVYRYRRDDGLPGTEGGFHLCATWLIEAYVLAGRRDEAEELFAQIVRAAGPTGLLAEEYDPIAERSLGNHPQAYSHLGLIKCAQLLS